MMCSIVSADHPASATVADGTSLQPGVVAPSEAISGFNSLITTAVWTDGLSSPGAQTAPRSPPPDEPRALRPVRIIHSLFPHKRPTVFFDYPTYVGEKRPTSELVETLPESSAMTPHFRIYNTHEYNCVRNNFYRAGFVRELGDEWCALWTKHLRDEEYASMSPFQKVNHFPMSWTIGRKDKLCRNLGRMKREFGDHYNISAPTYILPADRPKLVREMEDDPKSIWILKPPASSCGRGISLISKAAGSTLPNPEKSLIAQKYVKHPFLIDDYKFDLRIYALVTSFDPLKIYLFQNGLVRFCTDKYSLSSKNLKNRFGHLTNYSVNKKNEKFGKNVDAEQDGEGSKWSLQALLKWFQEHGIDDQKIMASISDAVIKTLISCEGEISAVCNRLFRQRNCDPSAGSACYELFGFDILLDNKLRAWVLEVNMCPSLSASSPLDRKIKNMLMNDVFHIVGFTPVDPRTVDDEISRGKLDRMLSRSRGSASVHRNAKQYGSITLGDLSLCELSVLCDLEDETHRSGHFTRIFPTEHTKFYHQFFETPRFNNFLLHTWITKWSGACGIEGLRSLVMARMRGGPTLYRKLSEPAPDTSADVSRSMSRRSSATGVDTIMDINATPSRKPAASRRSTIGGPGDAAAMVATAVLTASLPRSATRRRSIAAADDDRAADELLSMTRGAGRGRGGADEDSSPTVEPWSTQFDPWGDSYDAPLSDDACDSDLDVEATSGARRSRSRAASVGDVSAAAPPPPPASSIRRRSHPRSHDVQDENPGIVYPTRRSASIPPPQSESALELRKTSRRRSSSKMPPTPDTEADREPLTTLLGSMADLSFKPRPRSSSRARHSGARDPIA